MNRCLLFIASLVLTASAAAGPVVSIDPAGTRAAVGDVITLNVTMRDLPTTEGGGFSMRFNPRILQVEDVAINTEAWTFVNDAGTVDNNSGAVNDVLVSSFPGVSGNADIATITLRVVHAGKTKLTLEGSKKNPFASAGEVVPVSFQNATVKVARGGRKTK